MSNRDTKLFAFSSSEITEFCMQGRKKNKTSKLNHAKTSPIISKDDQFIMQNISTQPSIFKGPPNLSFYLLNTACSVLLNFHRETQHSPPQCYQHEQMYCDMAIVFKLGLSYGIAQGVVRKPINYVISVHNVQFTLSSTAYNGAFLLYD